MTQEKLTLEQLANEAERRWHWTGDTFYCEIAATLRACKGRGALQPIETAPKDGAWVLLCGGEVEYGWCGNEQPPAVVGQWVSGASVWQFAWYDSGFYGEYENPTHWAPLSDTPDTDTQAAERRGWNAAIEAAAELLPPSNTRNEIRALQKGTD